jgi:hypothetical protein
LIEPILLQGGGGKNLKVSPTHLCLRIFCGNHLALFGDADLPLHRSRGLREDGSDGGEAEERDRS